MKTTGIQWARVAMQEIDLADQAWQLRPPGRRRPPAELAAHIRKYGLIHPPLLEVREEGGFRVLSGFLRLSALRDEASEAPCLVLPSGLPPRTLLAVWLEHAQPATLSPVQRARFLVLAERLLGGPLRDRDLLSRLEIPPKAAPLFERLAAMPEPVQEAVHDQVVRLAAVALLERFSREEQLLLTGMLTRLRPGQSKQVRLLEMTWEIRQRTGEPLPALLGRWIEPDRPGQTTNAPQETKRLLAHLERLVSPALHRAEKEFAREVGRLELPPGAKVIPTRHFEDERVELVLPFASLEALREWWHLRRTAQQPSARRPAPREGRR